MFEMLRLFRCSRSHRGLASFATSLTISKPSGTFRAFCQGSTAGRQGPNGDLQPHQAHFSRSLMFLSKLPSLASCEEGLHQVHDAAIPTHNIQLENHTSRITSHIKKNKRVIRKQQRDFSLDIRGWVVCPSGRLRIDSLGIGVSNTRCDGQVPTIEKHGASQQKTHKKQKQKEMRRL